MRNLTCLDDIGEEYVIPVQPLSKNLNAGRFMSVISTEGFYYPEGSDPDADDPVSFGAIKFPLGEYQMFTVTLEFESTFTGGTIEVVSQNSASDDPRGEICDNAITHKYTTVTIESAEPVVAAAPVFSMDENYTITATCGNDYYVEINGVEVQLPYTVEQTYEEQTIVVSGYGYGDGMENSATVTETYVVPALEPTPAVAPTFIWDEETFTLTATCPNAFKVYVDDEEVDLPYTVTQTYEEQEIEVTGYGYGEHMTDTWATPATYAIPAMERPVTPVPVINVEQDENQTYAMVTITAEDDAIIFFSTDGEEYFEYDEALFFSEVGTYVVYASARADYPYTQSEIVSVEFEVKAAPEPEQTADPVFQLSGEEYSRIINITAEEGAVIYYSFDGVTYNEWTGDMIINQPGNYTIYAYAVAPDKTASGVVECTFTVSEQPTGVDEVMGGKTVANTRYFNMAGQEMSEANGVCIIVTTYTDGTTSAVKVMK